MFRKLVSILGLAMFLILVAGAGPAFADRKPPTWTPVYQAVPVAGMPGGYAIWNVGSFNDQLFMVLSSFGGAKIYRSLDGTVWSDVTPPGFTSISIASWAMQTYNGKLYLSVNDYGFGAHPALVLRTANGKDWETVLDGSLADLQGNVADKLGVYNGQIYLTTVWNSGQIWRSPSGNPGSWVLATPVLGSGVGSTSAPTVFKGDLYFSGFSAAGLQVWHSHNGSTWETQGAGVLDVPNNSADDNLAVFNGSLYLGATNTIDGGRIYRSKNGRDWELLGNQDFTAQHITDITLGVFDGELYAFGNDTISPGCEASCARILRSPTGKPGDWQLTNGSDGWGPGSAVIRNTQAIMKDHLYAANWIGSFMNGVGLFRLNNP